MDGIVFSLLYKKTGSEYYFITDRQLHTSIASIYKNKMK